MDGRPTLIWVDKDQVLVPTNSGGNASGVTEVRPFHRFEAGW